MSKGDLRHIFKLLVFNATIYNHFQLLDYYTFTGLEYFVWRILLYYKSFICGFIKKPFLYIVISVVTTLGIVSCISDSSIPESRDYSISLKNGNSLEIDSIVVVSVVAQDTLLTTYYKNQLSQTPATLPDSGNVVALSFLIHGGKGDRVEIMYSVYSAGFPILTKETIFNYTDAKPGHSVLDINEPVVALLKDYNNHALFTQNKEGLFDSLLIVHIVTQSDTGSQELVSSYLAQPGVDTTALAIKVRDVLLQSYNPLTAAQILTNKFPVGSDPEGLIARVEPEITPSSDSQTPLSSLGSVLISSGGVVVHVSSSLAHSSTGSDTVHSSGESSSLAVLNLSNGSTFSPVAETTAALCNDGLDNDGDGTIDCADTDCAAIASCMTLSVDAEKCNDTIDNDGDTLIDCADTEDCGTNIACQITLSSSLSSSSVSSSSILSSSVSSSSFSSSSSQPIPVFENTAALCGDGADNDKDGAIDCNDTDCKALAVCQILTSEVGAHCSDVIDNDNDGDIDCDDSDCLTDAYCIVSSSAESSSSSVPQEGTIQFTCDPDGACTHKSTVKILEGESVSMTAIVVTGYDFKYWNVVGEGLTKTNSDDLDYESITVRLDNTKGGEVRAKFEPKQYTVALVNVQHGSVKVNDASVSSIFTLEYGVQATIEAIPDLGWEFESWNAPNTLIVGRQADALTTIAKSSVDAQATIALTPTFVGSGYQATVSIDSMFAAGMHCPDGRTPTSPSNCGWGSGHVEINGIEVKDFTYNNGSTVTLNAVAKIGNRFKEWVIDQSINSTVSGSSVTIQGMSQGATVRAVFDSLTVGVVAETGNPSKTYTWKRYGNQIWMTENLNVVTNTSVCPINGLSTHCTTYGSLYKFQEARSLCESALIGDWVMSSDEAWKEFEIFIKVPSGEIDNTGYRGTVGKTLASSTSDWKEGKFGTNTIGFNAKPAGYAVNGTGTWYYEYALFWAGTNNNSVWTRDVAFNENGIGRYDVDATTDYYSTRCIIDY